MLQVRLGASRIHPMCHLTSFGPHVCCLMRMRFFLLVQIPKISFTQQPNTTRAVTPGLSWRSLNSIIGELVLSSLAAGPLPSMDMRIKWLKSFILVTTHGQSLTPSRITSTMVSIRFWLFQLHYLPICLVGVRASIKVSIRLLFASSTKSHYIREINDLQLYNVWFFN